MEVHPGEMTTIVYEVANGQSRDISAQAIPSYAPKQATQYFKKIECFCFKQQTLKAKEAREMPVVFVIDPALPKDVKNITLSYTFFEVGTPVAQAPQGRWMTRRPRRRRAAEPAAGSRAPGRDMGQDTGQDTGRHARRQGGVDELEGCGQAQDVVLADAACSVLVLYRPAQGAEHERDMARLNPLHVIIAGLLGAALFIAALIVIVRMVVGEPRQAPGQTRHDNTWHRQHPGRMNR